MSIKSPKAESALAYAKEMYETGVCSKGIAVVDVLRNLKMNCNVFEFDEAIAYIVHRALFHND